MGHKNFILLLALLISMVASVALAHDFEVDGIYYEITSSADLTVAVSYKGNYYSYSVEYYGNVTIPSSVSYNSKTYSVTSIADHAFSGCTGLTSVTIGNSVTSIADYAFSGCTGLTSVTIGNSVRSIGGSAFYNCSNLTSIEIPNSVTSIEEGAFQYTAWYKNQPNGLVYAGKVAYAYKGTMPENTSIVLQDGTLGIASRAFSDCFDLTSIEIPNSVTSIGDEAFEGCSGLTSIEIPNSVTSIGSSAFLFCEALTSIEIPNSVTSIGYSAFIGTSWFDNQPDGLVYAGKVAYAYKGTMPENTSIVLQDGTLGIADEAFYQCIGLTSITIPNSVTNIGEGAFQDCTGLTSVTIGSGVTSIGSYAFLGCTGLTSITIPGSVGSIGEEAFSDCSGLTSVTIGNGVTSIGSSAFLFCEALTSIEIPNSVKSIGQSAFAFCFGLTSVTIGKNVTSIGEFAFSGTGLTSVSVYFSVPIDITSYTFEYRQYAILYVPKGCKETFEAADYWKEFKEIIEIEVETDSTFEVTPDDAKGWNDLSRPHRLTVNGTYENPDGLDGVIDYAVEDSQNWTAMTDTLSSGNNFTGTLIATFDETRPVHVIKFRMRDSAGNTKMLNSIEYIDVSFHALSGIEEKTYTGDSLFQTNITCDLDVNQYVISSYRNNLNAGTASFNLEGVYPYTIGRKSYTFTISPQPLSGELVLDETSFVYSGEAFTPDWTFSDVRYENLEPVKDYNLLWENNRLPGTGTLTITGKNNYTGAISANIFIDKGRLTNSLYTLTLPDADITFDGESHGASITTAEGVGETILSYQKQGYTERTTTQPTEAGEYTIYLEIADGTLYYGNPLTQVGSFTIYEFSADEWAILQIVLPQLTEMGWSQHWDASQGMKGVSSIKGLTIEKGHITGFDLAGQSLSGTFPYAILALPKLQDVNLSGNRLSGDIGTAIYAYAEQHPEQVANINTLDISGNKLKGNVSFIANSFPSLTSLKASDNCFEEVYPALSPNITELDLSKQTIARIVPLHLNNLSPTDIALKVPSILLYDHTKQTYTTDINLLSTTADGNWGIMMSYQNGQLSFPYVSEQNAYYGESGDTLNVAVINNYGSPEGSTFRITLSFDEGDGNFDGQVNVLDLQTTLNYMFDEYEDKPFNFTASNLWKDDVINVQDAVSLVNILLDSNLSSVRASNKGRRKTAMSLDTDATVFVSNGELILNTADPVSSFDIVVATSSEFKPNESLVSAGFTCSVRSNGEETHLVGYSLSGATIPAGLNSIGVLEDGIVTYSMLADSNANEIKSPFNDNPTNIDFGLSGSKLQGETYRIPLGAKRAIVIDVNGKKYMVTEK